MFYPIYPDRKTYRILALAVMVLAIAAMFAARPASAAELRAKARESAASALPLGKLRLYATNGLTDRMIAGAAVEVYGTSGAAIAKGSTDRNGYFATYLQAGEYKVKVFASGYKEFGRVITIAPRKATEINAVLQLDMTRDPLPVNW